MGDRRMNRGRGEGGNGRGNLRLSDSPVLRFILMASGECRLGLRDIMNYMRNTKYEMRICREAALKREKMNNTRCEIRLTRYCEY